MALGLSVGLALAVGLAFATGVGLAFGAGVALAATVGRDFGAAVGPVWGDGLAAAAGDRIAVTVRAVIDVSRVDAPESAGGPSTTPTTCGASGPSVMSHVNGACGGTCTGTSDAITSSAAVATA